MYLRQWINAKSSLVYMMPCCRTGGEETTLAMHGSIVVEYIASHRSLWWLWRHCNENPRTKPFELLQASCILASIHRQLDSMFNRIISKITLKLRITLPWWENSPVTGGFLSQPPPPPPPPPYTHAHYTHTHTHNVQVAKWIQVFLCLLSVSYSNHIIIIPLLLLHNNWEYSDT